MWKYIAGKIIRNKLTFLGVVAAITGFMIYETCQIKLSYDFARVLPTDDPAYVEYMSFKKKFGEDGNVMVIGFNSTNLFEQKLFNDWGKLNKEIKSIQGIKDVLSISSLFNVSKDDSLSKFNFTPISPGNNYTPADLDSIKTLIYSLPF